MVSSPSAFAPASSSGMTQDGKAVCWACSGVAAAHIATAALRSLRRAIIMVSSVRGLDAAWRDVGAMQGALSNEVIANGAGRGPNVRMRSPAARTVLRRARCET